MLYCHQETHTRCASPGRTDTCLPSSPPAIACGPLLLLLAAAGGGGSGGDCVSAERQKERRVLLLCERERAPALGSGLMDSWLFYIFYAALQLAS